MHCEMLFFFERIEYPNSKASSDPVGSAEISDVKPADVPDAKSQEAASPEAEPADPLPKTATGSPS